MSKFVPLIIIIFVLFFIGAIVAIVISNQKRKEAFATIARELKLQFFPKGDDRIAPLLANLEFFHYGHNCKVSNLIYGNIARGNKSVTVAVFDYQYAVGTEKTFVNYDDNSLSVTQNSDDIDYFSQTVLVFHDENIQVPGFNLRPENCLDKIGNFVGFEDINFDNFPKFSKRYRLDAYLVDEVRDLFQPNLLKFYEGHEICTEANGSAVLIYPFGNKNHRKIRQIEDKTFTNSSFIDPQEIKQYLNMGLRLLGLLERNLVENNAKV